jgi:hypothetical protein
VGCIQLVRIGARCRVAVYTVIKHRVLYPEELLMQLSCEASSVCKVA